jgi:DNA polymerase III subunit beta
MLARLQGFLSKKAGSSLSSVLSNVLLDVNENGILKLSATDLEISFHGHLEVQNATTGSLCVDGKRLYAMIKQLPEEEVQIEVNEKQELMLTSGWSEISLAGLEAQEFPEISIADDVKYFAVKGGIICELFERSFFSSSSEESRPNLNGVYFQCMPNNQIRTVATDGHRLTVIERNAAVDGTEIPTMAGQIIPRKAVSELKRLLEEYPEVELAFAGQNLIVKTADFSIMIRLIADKFPPYEAVIPKSNDLSFIFDRYSLLQALKRMGLVGEDKRQHGVRLDFQGDDVLLESHNANLGKVNERLKLQEESSAEDMTVAFSVQYMIDVLNVIKGDRVKLCLAQAEKVAGIFKDLEYPQDTFVVMPRRL